MTKAKRTGRVFVDWSQNSRHKTTVAAVFDAGSAAADGLDPGRWDEVARRGDRAPLSFETHEVLARIESTATSLLETASLVQRLPVGR